MDKIRILIADDHTLFRDGLHALLNTAADLDVVGEAPTGEEAITQAAALLPDVILMDIQMPGANGTPGVNGIEATRHILRVSPHMGVIVVTMLEDDDSVFAAMRAGARGYVLKGADKVEIVSVIRAVARGEALFGPYIARRLTSFFAGLDSSLRSTTPHIFPRPDRTGLQQRRYRRSANAQSQDREQSCLQHLQQIAGG
jgi:DNA-binding NarL/FixJ family response regulator